MSGQQTENMDYPLADLSEGQITGTKRLNQAVTKIDEDMATAHAKNAQNSSNLNAKIESDIERKRDDYARAFLGIEDIGA